MKKQPDHERITLLVALEIFVLSAQILLQSSQVTEPD
jgi:hypothetical protein